MTDAEIEAAWQAQIVAGQTYTDRDRAAFESGYRAAFGTFQLLGQRWCLKHGTRVYDNGVEPGCVISEVFVRREGAGHAVEG